MRIQTDPHFLFGMVQSCLAHALECLYLMDSKTRIQHFRFHSRRTLRQSLAVLVAVVLSCSLAWSQGTPANTEVQAVDPAREWLGPEYADTIVALMRKNHPDLELTIDINEIQFFSEEQRDKKSLKEALKDLRSKDSFYGLSFHQRLIEFARNILPGAYSSLVAELEAGSRIGYTNRHLEKFESKLMRWIQKQPDHSITPDRLMEQALIITQGRIISAWMLVWNVVREGWPSAGTRNYGFIQKFVSMTGERHLWKSSFQFVVVPPEEREVGPSSISINGKVKQEGKFPRYLKMVVTKRGDDFSYLYHRVGVELLAMVVAKHTGFSILGRAAGSAGAFGEWFKFQQTSGLHGENKKRVSNDYTAAASGARLYLLAEKKVQPAHGALELNPNYYLKPNPKKYGDRYQLPDGRPAAYFGSKVDAKFWLDSMSVEELTYRFHHATRYDAEIFNPVVLAGGGDYDRLHRGLKDYAESTQQSEELNSYLRDYLSGMRGEPHRPDVTADIDIAFSGRRGEPNQAFADSVEPGYDFAEFEKRIQSLVTRVLAHKSAQIKNRAQPLSQQMNAISKPQSGAVSCTKAHR